MNGQELDAIARRRIAAEGVEPYGHGLGHGIGLETHEPPRLRESEAFTLEAGMVFSVEPGIYLPGVTGIRIEDIVALEEAGPAADDLAARGARHRLNVPNSREVCVTRAGALPERSISAADARIV